MAWRIKIWSLNSYEVTVTPRSAGSRRRRRETITRRCVKRNMAPVAPRHPQTPQQTPRQAGTTSPRSGSPTTENRTHERTPTIRRSNALGALFRISLLSGRRSKCARRQVMRSKAPPCLSRHPDAPSHHRCLPSLRTPSGHQRGLLSTQAAPCVRTCGIARPRWRTGGVWRALGVVVRWHIRGGD